MSSNRKKPKQKMVAKNELRRKKPWKGSQSLALLLRVPPNVSMICKLMNIEPEVVIRDFLSCLAMERSEKNPEVANTASIDFFIRCGYGNDRYAEQEIRQMFKELVRINDLWPEDGNMKFINQHTSWRKRYWKYWFKKWYWKLRRKKSDEIQSL